VHTYADHDPEKKVKAAFRHSRPIIEQIRPLRHGQDLKFERFYTEAILANKGSSMGKVINLSGRLKNRISGDLPAGTPSSPPKESSSGGSETTIVDMTEARQQIINNERRDVKRTILTEFIGAFAVLPERGLMRISLYDISDRGISFDVELTEGRFLEGEEVAMRVYLNHKTYFPFVTKITYSRPIELDGITRHGANFADGTVNDVALHHFVKFIETVSASLKTDDGDIQVSHIS
jgi:hypothetical protein